MPKKNRSWSRTINRNLEILTSGFSEQETFY